MESKEDTNSHQENANPVIPPVSPEDKEEHSPTREPAANQKPNNDKNISNVLMVMFTGVLAAAAIGQFIVFCFQWSVMSNQLAVMDNQLREMREGGKDTHELAVSAKNQAGSTKAVADRTLDFVKATNKLAQEAKRSADIADNALRVSQQTALNDKRPWVGVRDIQCDNCYAAPDGALTIGGVVAVMENTGRAPAIRISVHKIGGTARPIIPDYDTAYRDMAYIEPPRRVTPDNAARIAKMVDPERLHDLPATTVLPPSSSRTFPILGKSRLWRDNSGITERRNVFYIVGKITYYGTERDRQYATKFCIISATGTDFDFCPTGNDME